MEFSLVKDFIFFIYLNLIIPAFSLNITHAKINDNHDSEKTIPEYIIGYGYAFEKHSVITDDGYILPLFRIPGKINERLADKPPIFMIHGIFDTGFTFFIKAPPEKNLGFLLSNLGYDVWVGNNRGTMLGKEHINKTDYNYIHMRSKYWDFSFDHMAKYDLPAMINYVLNHTSYQQLTYFGHSQGTTQFFAHACQDPEYFNQRIKSFVGLAPIIYVYNVPGMIEKYGIYTQIPKLFYKFELKDLFSLDFEGRLEADIVRNNPNIPIWDIIQIFTGRTKNQTLDPTRSAVIVRHCPGGTSAQNLYHWVQLIQKDGFRMFDYGYVKNMQIYGKPTPDDYNVTNLTKLKFRKYFIRGEKDNLISNKDFNRLAKLLNPNVSIVVPDYGHNDVIWADDAHVKIYPDLLKWLSDDLNKESTIK